MTNFTRLKISVAAALVFSIISGASASKSPVKQNIFFPSQAISADNDADVDEPLTVVRDSDRIEISFRIVELIRGMFK